MKILKLVLVLTLIFVNFNARAMVPCPPPGKQCSLEDKSTCAWIIEGKLTDIQLHPVVPLSNPEAYSPRLLSLSEVEVIKGAFYPTERKTTIIGLQSCHETIALPAMLGKRIRLYGQSYVLYDFELIDK